MRTIVFIATLFVTATAALSQGTDNQAILDAIKGFNKRLDGMQKQIDELKGGGLGDASGAPQRSTAPAAKSPAAAPAGMRAEPGWVINVLPEIEGQREPDALFRFTHARLPIKFNAHNTKSNIGNWVKYRGEGQLQIYEAGRHLFLMNILGAGYNGYGTRCGGYLRVGANTVIDLGDETKDRRNMLSISDGETKSVSGGLNLEVGNYDISFLAACDVKCNLSGFEGCRKAWHSIAVDLQVRGPTDDLARPFTSKELIHLVRQKAAAPAGTKTPPR